MDVLGDISTDLAAAAIAAVAVAIWQIIVRWRRFRGTRRFWAPFVTADCLCVTGNLTPEVLSESFPHTLEKNTSLTADPAISSVMAQHIKEQEPSGLMGRGDHDALIQVQAGLARIGLQTTVPEHAGRLTGPDLRKSLIVVGGPDVNPTTAALLKELPCRLVVTRDDQDRNVVRDETHEHDHVPGGCSNGRLRDYGILIRAKNPRNPKQSVLILAGTHGFGSVAAAVSAFTDDVQLQSPKALESGFECLVCHERDDNDETSLGHSTLIFIRPLPTKSKL